MNDKIRLAVIGVGHLGQYHVKNLQSLEGVELVGIIDTNLHRALEISKKYKVPMFQNYQDLLGKIDGITVVVPTREHYIVAKYFLENGIHTLLEKPITSDIQQASELVKISHKKKVILQVGHVERFNSALVKLKEYIKEPRFIECHRLSTFDPRVKDVGVVLDLMIHDIDIINTLVNSSIKSIEAVGLSVMTPFDDIANARITFANGCIANLTASRIAQSKMRKIRIFQKDGYYSLDYMKPELEIYRKVVESGQFTIQSFKWTFKTNESLKAELESFVRSIREGTPPEVTGEHGQDALEMALQITQLITEQNYKC